MVDIGKIAYDGYGDHRGWKVFSGDPMPTWEEQSEDLRAAWTEAADTLLQTVFGTDHYVTFDADGWFIEHSVACRLAGTLGTCVYGKAIREVYDDPVPPDEYGRWRITNVDELMPSLERDPA